MTSEHAFQAMKFFPDKRYMDLVHGAPTPGQAANKHGRNRSYPLRPDWDSLASADGPDPMAETISWVQATRQPDDMVDRLGSPTEHTVLRVKDVIMFEVCHAKFTQHEDIRQILLSTGDQPLIEDTTDDTYWGWGSSKVGQNKLGRILMHVRHFIRLGVLSRASV